MALCCTKLHLVALRNGPCLMRSHIELPATHWFYIPGKGRVTPGNLYPLSSTAVAHCLLNTTHFIDQRQDDSLCQARECHRELTLTSEASVLPGPTATCSLLLALSHLRYTCA